MAEPAAELRDVIAGHPGMTSWEERWALHEAARTHWAGAGHIVDLGCWLGSLTMPLALGLERNPSFRSHAGRVHAYDSFVWQANYMDSEWPAHLPMERPLDGATFLPAFEHLIRPVRQLIDVHQEDLASTRWTGEPIELLSVDAMKSEPVAQRVIAEFYPALIAERSLLFHQDFCHGYTWWIHVHHFLLHEHFELADDLPGSGGLLFRVVRPVTPERVAATFEADLSDSGLTAAAFSLSMELAAVADRGAIAVAYARCEAAQGRMGVVRRVLDEYRDDPATIRELENLGETALRELGIDPS